MTSVVHSDAFPLLTGCTKVPSEYNTYILTCHTIFYVQFLPPQSPSASMPSAKEIAPGSPTNQEKSSFRRILSRVSLLKANGKLSGHPDARVSTKRGWKAFLRPFARKMTPIADVGASIAEAVPVLGAPLKGSLDALTKTLKIIEVR